MTTIVTRSGKGSTLTWSEMDANLTNLNNDKVEASALSSYETTAHASSTYATQTALSLAVPSQTGNSGKFLTTNGSNTSWAVVSGSGTVTNTSVVSANGFSGSVANSTSTPAITLSVTFSGLAKGNGTSLSAASAGTDYVAPGAITSNGVTMSTARMLGRTTGGTGAIEEISIGSNLTLSGGVLSATTGNVTSVGGYTGVVTNAQVASAASAGYGYTPASSTHNHDSTYIKKDLNAGNYPVGTMITGFFGHNNAGLGTVAVGNSIAIGPTPGTTLYVADVGQTSFISCVAFDSTWRVVGTNTLKVNTTTPNSNDFNVLQRIV